jgi:aspartate/methionine/tyrosine aminotransferase
VTKFQPFEMERLMSVWEQAVDFNLSESGVHPLSLTSLLGEGADIDAFLGTELGYPEVNGTPLLRQRIAALYGHGAGPENVLVTVGCAEALFITLQTLAEDGGEVAVMLPNYMHAWGTAQNVGLDVREFHLRSDAGWALDVDELESVVGENTRAIAICNPNNPTGYAMTEAEMDAVVAAADRVGAWIIADEVYAGAERLTDTQTPSFWGRYDRVLALNSLSKAYGLPGLRLGWVTGPTEMLERIWRRHEYSTLACTMLAIKLGEIAVSPEVRPRIIERTRTYVRGGYSILENWLESFDGLFEVVAPQAAAIALVRYHLDIGSLEFAERLIHEKSVLTVPGKHFGAEQHLRLSFGPPPEYVSGGLERVGELVASLVKVAV